MFRHFTQNNVESKKYCSHLMMLKIISFSWEHLQENVFVLLVVPLVSDNTEKKS